MSHVLAPGPRRIRAIWSHVRQDWTYRSEQYNQIPFVIHAMGSTMKVEAQKYLKPAPALSEKLKPYPYFNYRKDTLVLDYLRCGNTPKYINEYIEAIDTAAAQLELSQDRPGEHTLKHLEVSFCCQVRDFAAIIHPFLNLNLDKLILVLHNHDKVFDYGHDYEKWARLTHRDSNWVWRKLNRGAHLGYPFKVEVWNPKGFRMDDDFILIEDMPSDEEYDSESMNEHPWVDEPPTESEEEDEDDEEGDEESG
jgi:hypothetical protein